MNDHNIRVFEQHAREYDNWFETHAYVYESEVAALRSLLPHGGNTLEVGVGTGHFASRLGIKVGVEPAHAMASIARQRGIEVYEKKAEDLPFVDESFETVVLVTAICFFGDLQRALQETQRVLKPEGHIIIGMIDKDSPLGKAYDAKKHKSTFYRHAHFCSVTQVIERLTQLGFGHFEVRQTIFGLPEVMTATEPVKDSYGEGEFIVIGAQKEVKT